METLERLPEEVTGFIGVGIPDLSAKLVKRTERKAMYLRWDGVYEVFRIEIKEAETVFNNSYPRREKYPTNDDFGKTAWCFQQEKYANQCYDAIPDTKIRERGEDNGAE